MRRDLNQTVSKKIGVGQKQELREKKPPDRYRDPKSRECASN